MERKTSTNGLPLATIQPAQGSTLGGAHLGAHLGAPSAPLGPAHPSGAGTGLLFLREEQMRLAQDLFFFAYRDLTASADAILEELDLGRAHHRALHFIGRRPGIAVSELLTLLRITKQSLARVLSELVERGYVLQVQGPVDRRQRLLSLTEEGQGLERQLFERQRQKMVAAYRDAGGAAVEGFRRVMRGVMDPETRQRLDPSDAQISTARPDAQAPPLRQGTPATPPRLDPSPSPSQPDTRPSPVRQASGR